MAASRWTPIRLGAVCTKIGSGATPRGGGEVYLRKGPYALIRSQNVYNDGFRRDGLAFIGEEHAAELGNVEVLQDDILLNITGDSVARACQVDPAILPARVNQHVAIIRPDPEMLAPRFLRYSLVCPDMQSKLLSWAGSGGTRNALTKSMIESLEVIAPVDIDEQRAIAHILGTLDDKIELSRRMNETLETMARALFTAWFAETSPPRTKAADLIHDGVMEIGDGYRAKNSELGATGLPFIRAADLDDGFATDSAGRLLQESVAKAGKKIARRGDVAFTSKGTIGRFARVTADGEFVYSPQVCYWRSLDHHRLHPTILYCWMRTDDLMAQIEAVAGQTDMAPYVSLQDQRAMSVPLFPRSQHAIAARIDPLLARQSRNVVESRTLVALRDTLVPKLVSGEVRINDAERITGNVV
jgi:type I restriction enzyme S subunit